MNIIFMTTELSAVSTLTGGIGVNTTQSRIAPYVQEGVNLGSNSSFFIQHDRQDDFWFSCHVYRSGNDKTTGIVEFFDSSYSTTQGLFRLAQTTSSSGLYAVQYWAGAAWADCGGGSFAIGAATKLDRFDFHIKPADTGARCDFYLNGLLVAASTVDDMRLPGVSGIDRIVMRAATNSGSNVSAYSAMIVADEDTRSLIMVERVPSGNGDATAWKGDYTNVNSIPPIDTSFIYPTAAGQAGSFVHSALPAALNGFEVLAVALSMWGSEGIGSDLNVHGLFRIDGTNYDAGPMGLLEGANYRMLISTIDPSTSAAWTFSTAASQFGALAVSA